jgi:hypothetical protein
MDLILFSWYVALMGALSFLIALLTQLHTQAKRANCAIPPIVPIDIEKLRDFKASILPLVVALVARHHCTHYHNSPTTPTTVHKPHSVQLHVMQKDITQAVVLTSNGNVTISPSNS